MKRVILTFVIIAVAISGAAGEASAQGLKRSRKPQSRQDVAEVWKKDMEEFKARSAQDRKLTELTDSIASVQAFAAVKNQDFVLEADGVSYKNGMNVFVSSTINFISVKGNRVVVQISPNNYASGANGLGGVTVDGVISGQEFRVGKNGSVTYSFSVTGIGINAQVEVYMNPGTNRASAAVYPNFNSNTIWLQGYIVPYENSNVIEGNSL